MSSTTDSQYVAPKYLGLLTTGITTASVGAAGMVVLTTYGANAPEAITPGWTAITAVICLVGAGLVLTAIGLRIVMVEITAIRAAVDAHASHVAREHGGLHEDAVDMGEQLAELRGLVAQGIHENSPPGLAEQIEKIGEAVERIERKLVVLTGGNVVDLDTVRNMARINGHTGDQD